jgi:GH35 family endo-1,4-beta-xylanase
MPLKNNEWGKLMKNTTSILALATLVLATKVNAQNIDYSGKDIQGIEEIVSANGQAQQAWRIAANQRIENYRKSNLKLTLIDSAGQPLPGAKVKVEQVSHDFDFGGVISAKAFAGDIKSVDAQTYRQGILEFFNKIGFNNALKYKHKEGHGRYAQAVIDWAKGHQLPVRGHTLMWPGWKHMHKDALVYKDGKDLEGLRQFAEQQIIDYASRWDVVEWDLFNETRANQDLQKLLGKDVVVSWYQLAKEHLYNPDAKLMLNDYQVISALPGAEGNIDLYRQEVDYFLEKGVNIDAMGFQSRFKFDVSAEEIIRRLNHFNDYALPIVATEFEIRPYEGFEVDEAKRAQMTEMIMTAYFSHPKVDMIMAWTFASHLGPWALVNQDGSVKANGKVWLHLVKQRWHTDEEMVSDAQGQVNVRGFKGDYQLVIEHQGKRYVRKLSLLADQDKTLVIGRESK